jgi:hypothetical protein
LHGVGGRQYVKRALGLVAIRRDPKNNAVLRKLQENPTMNEIQYSNFSNLRIINQK